MLALVIQKKYQKIPKYFHFAELLELRVDLIKNFDLKWARFFLNKLNKPWILTIRKTSQGGKFYKAEKLRLELIDRCLELNPDFIDLEHDVSLSYVRALKKKHRHLKLIRSFHDFSKTPDNIESFIDSLFDSFFDIHKFAFFANSILDTMRMMRFLCKNKRAIALVALGKHGHSLRVVGKILKNAINYAAANKASQIASQLTLKKLVSIYNYPKLNKDTKIYVLIGENIEHSIGHLFHNFFFFKNNINAVYIKIPLKELELAAFFRYAKDLPIKGVSVTTPFKNQLSLITKSKSPINTLKKVASNWESKNTDGLAAFKITAYLIKKNAKILLLGAGPAALAIFKEFKANEFLVDVYNRSFSKAFLAYPTQTKIIKDFHLVDLSDYDLVINAASYKADFEQKIMCQKLKKELILLNINYQYQNQTKNSFVKYINGKDLFFCQAIFQQMFWNEQSFSSNIINEFQKKVDEGSISIVNAI